GVLGGKFLMNGLFDKVGLSFDEIHTSNNATMFSATHDYNPSEWARFESWLDRVYEDFTAKVAEGRKLPIEKVKEIAKGRIWSGEDARGLGLVDELGGYQTAIKLVRQAAKLSEKTKIHLKEFPEHRSPFERLADRMSGREDDASASAAAVTAEALESLRPLFQAAKAAGVFGNDGVLQMEDAEIARLR
ncbi:MAG TPA: S49 family peptidase, partial [Thermoanaerobaculia bacterium]|nr:S49 family peptidase [Thermoanaerobaculia bacterium]